MCAHVVFIKILAIAIRVYHMIEGAVVFVVDVRLDCTLKPCVSKLLPDLGSNRKNRRWNIIIKFATNCNFGGVWILSKLRLKFRFDLTLLRSSEIDLKRE